MSLRRLPDLSSASLASHQWDIPAAALERWSALPRAAASDDPATISIFEPIGENWDGSGFTPRRMSAILRSIGPKPVTVAVNSPGGSMFDGIAIYNLLQEHPAEVTVKVMGLAASAASVIAMAGDRVVMGLSSFLMIHNCWGVVVGDRQAMASAAADCAAFDAAMADIYAARSGADVAKIAAMMDAETFLGARAAIDLGLADETMDDPPPADAAADKAMSARARLDIVLAKAGMPRTARRALFRDALGTPGAPEPGTPRAAAVDPALVARLIAAMKP